MLPVTPRPKDVQSMPGRMQKTTGNAALGVMRTGNIRYIRPQWPFTTLFRLLPAAEATYKVPANCRYGRFVYCLLREIEIFDVCLRRHRVSGRGGEKRWLLRCDVITTCAVACIEGTSAPVHQPTARQEQQSKQCSARKRAVHMTCVGFLGMDRKGIFTLTPKPLKTRFKTAFARGTPANCGETCGGGSCPAWGPVVLAPNCR